MSPQKLALFTADVKFLEAKKNDCLIGLNDTILIGKSLNEITALLNSFSKENGAIITFTYIRQDSFYHPSLAQLTKVKYEIILEE